MNKALQLQDYETFHLRWNEFLNVVNISYSTLSDDERIKVYNPAVPPDNVTGDVLWCPILTNQSPIGNWLLYSNKKREAIRLGFMHGLCQAVEAPLPPGLFDWYALKAEFFDSIFQQNLNLVAERALRTKDYATGRERLETLLKTVYNAGQHVPYHPDFERAFSNQIRQHPHSVDLFLEKLCKENELTTPKDYQYLLKLMMDTGRRYDLDDYHALVPAMTWLCAQIADSTGDKSPPFAMFTQLANTEKENKRLKQLLAEERASPTAQSPVPTITIPELLPAKSPVITVATLCRLPFTPADLQALLQFLKLLDSNGNNITTDLQSRNRSRWGKFTAAYRVLQRNSLMETTTDDVEWAIAFEIAYKAKLGPDVRSHSLTTQGRYSDGSTQDFKDGVDDATFWVKRWVKWRGTAKNRPTLPFIAS